MDEVTSQSVMSEDGEEILGKSLEKIVMFESLPKNRNRLVEIYER